MNLICLHFEYLHNGWIKIVTIRFTRLGVVIHGKHGREKKNNKQTFSYTPGLICERYQG